jgi:general secretion pathway protein J
MTPRPARAERGFTLLEVLVAVTLLGLLMAALLGGVRLGVRAWEASDTRLDADARLTAVQDFLRERLTQARRSGAAAAGADDGPAWRGEPDRLSFVTLMPEHLGAGLERITLSLTPADHGADLTVEWWPAELGQDRHAVRDAIRTRVLLARVAELRLAYFGQVDPRQPPTWSEVWDQPSLPRLVRIQLRFPDGDTRGWPDLIVRPMIDGEIY